MRAIRWEVAIDSQGSHGRPFPDFSNVAKKLEMRFLPEILLNVFDIRDTSSDVIPLVDSYIAPIPLLHHLVPSVRLEAFERPERLAHIISKKRCGVILF